LRIESVPIPFSSAKADAARGTPVAAQGMRGAGVGSGANLRHRRLEYRHGLTQLRGPALELAQGDEQLLGSAGRDLSASRPGQPAGDGSGAPGMPQRQHGQPALLPLRA
jgi:hypothetical protein